METPGQPNGAQTPGLGTRREMLESVARQSPARPLAPPTPESGRDALPWNVTARTETPFARFEMCACTWPNPNEVEVCGEAPTLSILSRSRRNARGRSDGRYQGVAGADFTPLGDVIFQPGGTRVLTRGEGGEQRFLRIAFRSETLGGEVALAADYADPAVQRRLLHVREPAIQFGMSRVLSEFAAPGMAAEMLLDGLALFLGVEVSRYLAGAPRAESRFVGGLAPWQLRRISERINDDLATPPSLSELAAMVRLSARHMARAYRASTSRSLSEEIELARHARAEQMVLEGRLPMKEIALRLGFASQASFSTAFRRRAGCSPREFARRAE
jgi:AraC family transcriptional regulator